MSIKQDRLNERIRIILSELLLRDIADPRLQGVTVTEVSIDNELMYATIYVNALGEEEREQEVIEAFKRANGYLRREVGQRISTRNTPELHFKWDTTLAYGERINEILANLDIPADDESDE
ncbi:MAG: 30S ribosome-binding factor RbfA [Phototrophicaceae bacterium]